MFEKRRMRNFAQNIDRLLACKSASTLVHELGRQRIYETGNIAETLADLAALVAEKAPPMAIRIEFLNLAISVVLSPTPAKWHVKVVPLLLEADTLKAADTWLMHNDPDKVAIVSLLEDLRGKHAKG